MRNKINIFFGLGLLFLLLQGCDTDYVSPYTKLENDMVITCMIDSRNDINLIRVQKIYFHSTDNKKPDSLFALLSESSGESYELSDTLLDRNDDFVYFYIPKSYLVRDKYYRLTVISKELGAKWADCLLAPNPKLSIYGYWTPGSNPFYELRFEMAKHTTDYYSFRIFIEYEVTSQGGKILKQKQFPLLFSISSSNPNYISIKDPFDYKENEVDLIRYPVIQSAQSPETNLLVDIQWGFRAVINESVLKFVLNNLENDVPHDKIAIKGLFATFYSIDKNYYEYFMTKANEQFSIRLDQGTYKSNIQGANFRGYGFLGAITVDTARCKLDEFFIKHYGYVNGQ